MKRTTIVPKWRWNTVLCCSEEKVFNGFQDRTAPGFFGPNWWWWWWWWWHLLQAQRLRWELKRSLKRMTSTGASTLSPLFYGASYHQLLQYMTCVSGLGRLENPRISDATWSQSPLAYRAQTWKARRFPWFQHRTYRGSQHFATRLVLSNDILPQKIVFCHF